MTRLTPSLERQLRQTIAERIRARRMAVGVSQEALGEKANIHRTYIGAVERGEKNVTVVTLAKIAHALHCKLSDLLPDGVDAH